MNSNLIKDGRGLTAAEGLKNHVFGIHCCVRAYVSGAAAALLLFPCQEKITAHETFTKKQKNRVNQAIK